MAKREGGGRTVRAGIPTKEIQLESISHKLPYASLWVIKHSVIGILPTSQNLSYITLHYISCCS